MKETVSKSNSLNYMYEEAADRKKKSSILIGRFSYVILCLNAVALTSHVILPLNMEY